MKKILILSLLLAAGLFSCGTANRAVTNSYPAVPFLDSTGTIVGIHPVFNGGNLDVFRRWVYERLTHPRAAQGIQGRVIVTFVVERDGKVGQIEVRESPHWSMSTTVVNILQSSPKWTPGYDLEGNPVAVFYRLPVHFRLDRPSNSFQPPSGSAPSHSGNGYGGF